MNCLKYDPVRQGASQNFDELGFLPTPIIIHVLLSPLTFKVAKHKLSSHSSFGFLLCFLAYTEFVNKFGYIDSQQKAFKLLYTSSHLGMLVKNTNSSLGLTLEIWGETKICALLVHVHCWGHYKKCYRELFMFPFEKR